jgi:hypothetical protein
MAMMSREEAREFKTRWRLVNEFIAAEIRNTPPEIKLKQLCTMFNSAYLFRDTDTSEEIEEVRSRWKLLKERLHA